MVGDSGWQIVEIVFELHSNHMRITVLHLSRTTVGKKLNFKSSGYQTF